MDIVNFFIHITDMFSQKENLKIHKSKNPQIFKKKKKLQLIILKTILLKALFLVNVYLTKQN